MSDATAGLTTILVFLVVIVISVVFIGFWVWMLIDCIKNEPDNTGTNEKIIWVVVIALTGWVGGLIYLFARRPKRKQLYGK